MTSTYSFISSFKVTRLGLARSASVVRNLDAWYDAFKPKETDALYLAPDKRVRIW